MSSGLVVENPKTRDIIKFHSSYYKNTTEVNFEGEVLVYVTPVSRKKRKKEAEVKHSCKFLPIHNIVAFKSGIPEIQIQHLAALESSRGPSTQNQNLSFIYYI